MKKTILLSMVTLSLALFSSLSQSAYKGKMTCQNINSLIDGTPDGRVRSVCDDALRYCIAKNAMVGLPQGNPLRTEIGASLENLVGIHLGVCELGMFAFAPGYYQENFAR